MSDAPTSTRRAKPATGRPLVVVWSAIALFLAMLALLATRVAGGQDPALRAKAASSPLPPRRVLIRRIYERRVIVHLPPDSPAQPSQATQQSGSIGSFTAGAVTRSS
jgi:hypothetical protein